MAQLAAEPDSPVTEEATFFYFIGRLNPPHQGHLETLQSLVNLANSQTTIPPLILVGSGPGGLRTMDDPIEYKTKEKFIKRVLRGNYVIKEKTNPSQNVAEYITKELESRGKNIRSIKIYNVAGGKDDDSTKLDFIKRIATNAAKEIFPEAEVTTDTIVMPATRSATKVRKDAYQTILDRTGFEGWLEEYKDFYGVDALEMYNEILFPISEMSEELVNEAVENYIETGTLPIIKGPATTNGQTTKRRTRQSLRSKLGGMKRKKYKRKTIKKRRRHKR
jgi:nicotinamide mononucleotide adenylyltransferase